MSVAFRWDPYAPPPLDYFQEDAAYAVKDRRRLGQKRLLVVMATGLGKAEIAAELARMEDGRVLALCHTEELVGQLSRRIERRTGGEVSIEQAELKASPGSRIVVASVQSMVKRLEKWNPNHFSLVIPDEAHRYMAPTYRKVLEHFTGDRVGFTATPKRLDKQGLRALFDYTVDEASMDLFEGIEQGWLVPVRIRPVSVKEVRLEMDAVAGDLPQGALDDEMVKGMLGIVRQTLEHEPHRKIILFAPGIRSAEVAFHAFEAHFPGTACLLYSGMPDKQREEQVMGFRNGTYSRLANVAIVIEGFDSPDVDCIIQARPTLSEAFYAQTLGRGTRILRDYIDGITGREQSEERRAAIAASPKPDCMCIDFVGNSSKHKDALVSPLDVLGHMTDEEKALAKKYIQDKPGAEAIEAIKAAREQVARAIAQVKVTVEADVGEVFDPFALLGLRFAKSKRKASAFSQATPGMVQILENIGLERTYLEGLSKSAAGALIDEFRRRRRQNLLSLKQYQILAKHGIEDQYLPFHRAQQACGRVIDCYRSGRPVVKAELEGILYGTRQPGEEG